MLPPNLTRLLRYIETCRNARLPGERIPFRIGEAGVGWVKPEFAKTLRRFPEFRVSEEAVVLEGAKAARLNEIAAQLAAAGLFRWRNESFDVRERPGGPVLCRLDRGALPLFGVLAEGVHCNCLVQHKGEWRLWVARRAPHKFLDPDKLDHLVAGGIPSGLSPREALIKEAAEEAGIPAELAAKAEAVGTVALPMDRPKVCAAIFCIASISCCRKISSPARSTAKLQALRFGRFPASCKPFWKPRNSSSTSTSF